MTKTTLCHVEPSHGRLDYDNTFYEPGDHVALDNDTAKRLLDKGAVSKKKKGAKATERAPHRTPPILIRDASGRPMRVQGPHQTTVPAGMTPIEPTYAERAAAEKEAAEEAAAEKEAAEKEAAEEAAAEKEAAEKEAAEEAAADAAEAEAAAKQRLI